MKRAVGIVIYDHPLDGALADCGIVRQEGGCWQIEDLVTVRFDFLLRGPVLFREVVTLGAGDAGRATELAKAGWRTQIALASRHDLESTADRLGLLDEAFGCDHERDTRAVLLAAWGAVNLLCDHEVAEDDA